VQLVDVVFTASPDDRQIEPEGEACLEIDAASVAREVGYDESRRVANDDRDQLSAGWSASMLWALLQSGPSQSIERALRWRLPQPESGQTAAESSDGAGILPGARVVI
jgi:hypothetical protein